MPKISTKTSRVSREKIECRHSCIKQFNYVAEHFEAYFERTLYLAITFHCWMGLQQETCAVYMSVITTHELHRFPSNQKIRESADYQPS